MMEALSPWEKKLLLALAEHEGTVTPEEVDMELVKTMNASSWLQSKGLVECSDSYSYSFQLSKEGETFLRDGLPEKNLLHGLERERIRTIEERLGKKEAKIAIGWAKRKGWCDIVVENGEKFLIITDKGKRERNQMQPEEEVLAKIKNKQYDVDEKMLQMLLKRGAVKKLKGNLTRKITLTEEGWKVVRKGITLDEEVSQLTAELIKRYAQRGELPKLRKYDVTAFAPSVYPGKLHPLTQLIEKIRKVFSEMGFAEIKGSYLEPCFWNMDALFIPQDHPARDMQDTFYCKKPATMKVDGKLIDAIARVHENGGATGSIGWRYHFDRSEAERVLLRTHSTVNTIRYLYHHPSPPAKVFSIERVFRRENIDSTHLPEFHQIEGIVHEEGANFSMLKGLLKEFYARMGFTQIRFRPSYFPYTEPSLEIEIQWNGRWIELGGAGIFRPEVTIPFGVEEPVLAWGLGLERMAMIVLGLSDIRMLYFSDLQWLNELPLL